MTLYMYHTQIEQQTEWNEIFIHEIYGILSQKLMTSISTTNQKEKENQVLEIQHLHTKAHTHTFIRL